MPPVPKPNYGWAVLHNWLYFLSLGLCIPVLPRVVASVVNPDGSTVVSAASSQVGGDVEGLDKLLTFLTVGALGALSDHVGRKPLIAASAIGYASTVAIQASTKLRWHLYAADLIDGATSCMNAVCSAYVVDATPADDRRAVAVGTFQGLSAAGAFVLGFPLAGILARKSLRLPMWIACGIQLMNCLLALFVTPESVKAKLPLRNFDAKKSNPVAALALLGQTAKFASLAFAFAWMANLALNTTFVNYVNKAFGWGPQQAGPLLVVVGFTLAMFPRFAVPRLGLAKSITLGALVYAAGYVAIGACATPAHFFLAIFVCGLGSVVIPALVAKVASEAKDDRRGATLGALQTSQELVAAAAYPLYGRVFAAAIRASAAATTTGGGHHQRAILAAPFYLAALFLVASYAVFSMSPS
ncbi:hypothetical protein CTAYLR_004276 [Chrysophaeum taylorii]|uniref:Major facilitator superfamily (MFS) profile domain-containing protein n=1 Tax=Chrysophaeum taylorii TaxID=2483200 RepID=A0AAD7UEK9_9STRA|nr:hypothetical protein CTAYLR_004276 [Chrysophaeum taylorii]